MDHFVIIPNKPFIIVIYLVDGKPTPLKNDGVKVSWDDEIPNIWENIPFMFQTNNQVWYMMEERNHEILNMFFVFFWVFLWCVWT